MPRIRMTAETIRNYPVGSRLLFVYGAYRSPETGTVIGAVNDPHRPDLIVKMDGDEHNEYVDVVHEGDPLSMAGVHYIEEG